MSCIKCGGTMVGDGYSSVISCEYADSEEMVYAAPDEGPFYCNYIDHDMIKKKLKELEDSNPSTEEERWILKGKKAMLKELLE